jgi:pimeloyl-ACP methyl ester carboxylesterase
VARGSHQPPPHQPRIVRLAQGRGLAFSEFGAADGFPVVNCHGGLLGRLDVAAADDAARQAGIRLISPDRPGIGASDPSPDRTLLDWPDDVAALADLLRIDTFGVMGWSMGGQYAAACAFALADRVTRAAIVAGCPPLDGAARFVELNRMDTTLTTLSRRVPWLARPIFATMGQVALRFPRQWTRASSRSLGPTDAAVLAHEPAVDFARASGEALRTSAGMVTEYRVWVEPWGFGLEDITIGVDVWQGDQDQLVPVAWADEITRRIPNATRHDVPGAGHLLAHGRYGEILTALRPDAG